MSGWLTLLSWMAYNFSSKLQNLYHLFSYSTTVDRKSLWKHQLPSFAALKKWTIHRGEPLKSNTKSAIEVSCIFAILQTLKNFLLSLLTTLKGHAKIWSKWHRPNQAVYNIIKTTTLAITYITDQKKIKTTNPFLIFFPNPTQCSLFTSLKHHSPKHSHTWNTLQL